jgi:hypothetical protein
VRRYGKTKMEDARGKVGGVQKRTIIWILSKYFKKIEKSPKNKSYGLLRKQGGLGSDETLLLHTQKHKLFKFFGNCFLLVHNFFVIRK